MFAPFSIENYLDLVMISLAILMRLEHNQELASITGSSPYSSSDGMAMMLISTKAANV